MSLYSTVGNLTRPMRRAVASALYSFPQVTPAPAVQEVPAPNEPEPTVNTEAQSIEAARKFLEALLRERSLKIHSAEIGASVTWGLEPRVKRFLDRDFVSVCLFEPQEFEHPRMREVYGQDAKILANIIGDGSVLTYYQTNEPTCGSCLPPKLFDISRFHFYPDVEIKAVHQMQSSTLDQAFKANGFGLPQVLFMDMQGLHEKAIISSPETMAGVLVVQPEANFYQFYDDEPVYETTAPILKARGFGLYSFYHIGSHAYWPFKNNTGGLAPWFREGWAARRSTWSMPVFYRKQFDTKTMDVNDLLRGAYILHERYDGFDAVAEYLALFDKLSGTNYTLDYIRLFDEAIVDPAGKSALTEHTAKIKISDGNAIIV